MTDIFTRALDNQMRWSTVASGQLGALDALMVYAIDALKGRTAASQDEVADLLEQRLFELRQEQKEKLFPEKN